MRSTALLALLLVACSSPGAEFGGPWWALDLRSGWSGQREPECATITRVDGVGWLQISATRKDAALSDADLLEFARELADGGEPVAVRRGSFTGFEYRYVQDGASWLEYFLRCDSTFIYVTYNCPVPERDAEGADVREMLDTLRARGS